ncbi:MAG TPA: hypothetical protein VH309_08100 [Elusimicrobiota bacterium]|jgi:hypothetical protein|nr:hypothetical protein [Elusimicrobiota bacterium]
MRLKIAGAAALAAALAGWGTSARAQGGADPCTSKIMQECQSQGGDLGACMRGHMSELMACRNGGASPAEAQAKEMRGMRELCGKEIKKYCPKGGDDDALRACLQEHSNKLGHACRESGVASARRAKKELHATLDATEAACKRDGERLCPGKTFKTGLGPCLKAHRSRVSAKCRDAVMGAQNAEKEETQRFSGGN